MNNDLITFISTVGFPIVACIGLGYFLYMLITRILDQLDRFADSLDRFNDTLIKQEKRLEFIEGVLLNE